MLTILRDAGLWALIPSDSSLEKVCDGFQFTEGPLWLPADDALLFQDIKAERTYRVGRDGKVGVVRENTGAANGQTFASDGSIVFCEQNGRRVSRMSAEGYDVSTLVESFEGNRLNSPNDIVASAEGTLYFTDPPYGAPPDRPLAFQGIYAVRLDGSLRLLADDFEKPNGLAFSPDGKTLYVCDTAKYHVRAFDVATDGSLVAGSNRVLATLDPTEPGGPDGMKVDRDGRIYVAAAQGIWVFEPGGRFLGILATPKRPSNLAWSGFKSDALAITMVDAVYRVRLNVSGFPPPFQRY